VAASLGWLRRCDEGASRAGERNEEATQAAGFTSATLPMVTGVHGGGTCSGGLDVVVCGDGKKRLLQEKEKL